ncbi:unnamed protein product, partial [Adineta steineri]
MLKVIVHNAEHVPNSERFTNIDPMVVVIFQGITKQTTWQRSTCDPKWDETLEFPLNDVPIIISDRNVRELQTSNSINSSNKSASLR